MANVRKKSGGLSVKVMSILSLCCLAVLVSSCRTDRPKHFLTVSESCVERMTNNGMAGYFICDDALEVYLIEMDKLKHGQ